ncbi:hypothetical protein ABC733_17005 [Mangrovibacter sp. SLW1]
MTISSIGIDDLETEINDDLDSLCIKVSFSAHFTRDRMNDQRNQPPITLKELEDIFKRFKSQYAAKVVKLSDQETFLLTCSQTKINLPCGVSLFRKFNKPWVKITVLTVMRKDGYATNDKIIYTLQ